ncbi:MAG: Txe/YoeB family addiction module toxin [Prevotellaceae bacterium]|nr:Txe/YoeB family addiction module toxin [Prevotellaceae bacterium]
MAEIAELKKSEIHAYKKLQKLLIELGEHPYTGTGKPEKLKYDLTGRYSRHIDKKNRLIYAVNDRIVIVYVLSVKGHYGE